MKYQFNTQEPITIDQFRSNGHSYRNFSPNLFNHLIKSTQAETDTNNQNDKALSGLTFIEDTRFRSFIEAVTDVFEHLSETDKELFTTRNPETVQWIQVYKKSLGKNINTYWWWIARKHMTTDNLGENIANNPIKFSRRRRRNSIRNTGLIESLLNRDTEYSNWTPQEIQTLLDKETIELSKSTVYNIEYRTQDFRNTVSYPVKENPENMIRNDILPRIEGSRFNKMLKRLMDFYAPLDPDERKMFSKQNPGLVMWVSVYGESQHLIHQDQLGAYEYPTLGESSKKDV